MPNQLDLRSEETQEVLKQVPPFITRWGAAALLIVLTALLTASYFIKVPEKINGEFFAQQGQAGQLLVPYEKSGLITAGQTILIELDNYPSNAFGHFSSQVERIEFEAEMDRYVVYTTALQSTDANFQHSPRLPALRGQGAILLDEKRLLTKLWPFMDQIIQL